MPDTYPQLRISPAARKHLDKILPKYQKSRGMYISMTSLASEFILAIPVPENGNGKRSEDADAVNKSQEEG